MHDVKGGDLECCRVDIRCVVDCRCVLMAIVADYADTEFGRKEGAFDLLPYSFDLPYRRRRWTCIDRDRARAPRPVDESLRRFLGVER